MLGKLRRHRHFVIITTLLLLVMTFPTITYIFRTDVFWLPEREKRDLYAHFWDVWYGGQILTGQADRYYTDAIFYPEGVSLVYHPVSLLRSASVYALMIFLPLSNAFCLAYLAIIYTSALAAYVYLNWLFKDKWIALFGATVFGFSAQVTGYPAWPLIAWIAPIPIIVYCLHRGFVEKRSGLVLLAGLLTALSADTIAYQLVCVLITIGLFVLCLALSRWRDKHFWRSVALLIAGLALGCSWLVIPMLSDREQLDQAEEYASDDAEYRDLMGFFVNSKHPVLGPLATGALQTPDYVKLNQRAYLGVIPLSLILIGLWRDRRKMLPWAALLLVFLVLCLGSTLSVNGAVFENIKLPKHYLDQALPSVFAAFYSPSFFMTGAWLPLAVLSCYGLVALRGSARINLGSGVIFVLILLVAFEYYRPVYVDPARELWSQDVTQERVAYIDWLKSQTSQEIRLVNVPFGIHNKTRHSYFQTLSGYPQTDGATSRTPDSAYNFIYSNYLLREWKAGRPIRCEMTDQEAFLAGLDELEQVGFSHVIFHRVNFGWDRIHDSFAGIEPAYHDNYVSVYRMGDLRGSCPAELSLRHHYSFSLASALEKTRSFVDGLGPTVVFPPDSRVRDHMMWYLRRFARFDREVFGTVLDSQGEFDIQSSSSNQPEHDINLDKSNALWLLDVSSEYDSDAAAAARERFADRFKFCRRFFDDSETTLDLYLKVALPCQAVAEGSEFTIEYDQGVTLRNLYIEWDDEVFRTFLRWSDRSNESHSYTLQIFNQDGQKARQIDERIRDELLSVRDIDISDLQAGMYSVQLIVYDFETLASRAGALGASQQRFERQIEIAQFVVDS